ncbi:MAG: hypothetical protein AAGG75_16440 [Bacteroidota bacterium]
MQRIKTTALLLLLMLSSSPAAFSQIAINRNGIAPVSSAMLEITSPDKGLLIPRMTESNKENIANPATGLMIYQTDGKDGFHYYNGTGWIPIQGLPSSAIIYSETEDNEELSNAGYQLWGRDSMTIDSAFLLNDANTWADLSTVNYPGYRRNFDPVCTGEQLIIWGGDTAPGSYQPSNEGKLYHIATDTWTNMTTANPPEARQHYTSVWTGDKMIIWGGQGIGYANLNTGGIYDPSTDTWTSMTTTNAHSAAYYHTAVWTGDKMIVWGGLNTATQTNIWGTGGVYDPVTDSWTAVSNTNAPSARFSHTAVWTGTEMIIWGGIDGNGNDLNTGAKYNPVTDTWTAIAVDPSISVRADHGAIFINSKMIVTGGVSNIDGSRYAGVDAYDLATDSWTTLTPSGFARGEVMSIAEVDSIIYISYGSADSRKYFFDLNTNTGGVLSNHSNLDRSQEILTDGTNLYVYGRNRGLKYKLQNTLSYQTITKVLYLFQKQ